MHESNPFLHPPGTGKEFPDDISGYLQQYADPELGNKLQAAKDYNYRVRYQTYDWSLNDSDHGERTHDDDH